MLDREGMEVDDAVKSLIDVLVRDPVAERPEIIPEMDVPGGLHARKDPAHAVTAMAAHGRQSRGSSLVGARSRHTEPLAFTTWPRPSRRLCSRALSKCCCS